MADWADLAAEREQQLREQAIAAQRRKARSRDEEEFLPAVCLICDEPIPESRRRAIPGVRTCVDCQAELEAELARVSR